MFLIIFFIIIILFFLRKSQFRYIHPQMGTDAEQVLYVCDDIFTS